MSVVEKKANPVTDGIVWFRAHGQGIQSVNQQTPQAEL